MHFALTSLLLAACDQSRSAEITPPRDTAINDVADGDADGFDVPEDCDDEDATVYPGATDRCGDEVDADCDGYDGTDADGDGAPAGPGCDDDCDDSTAEVHPGAEELCNAIDDDCDGEVDDGATDAQSWYRDSDGDGYGDGSHASEACTQPRDHVDNATDCDDDDDAIHPAAEETCGNGIDDDCDGGAGDCGLSGELDVEAVALALVGTDADGRVGSVVTGGCDGIAFAASSVRAEVFVVPAAPTAGGLLEAAALRFFDSSESGSAPSSMACDDLDGDGTGDLILGVSSSGGAERASYIHSGPFTESRSFQQAEGQVAGVSGSNFGFRVATGNFDGSGYTGLAVSANGADTEAADDVGVVYVFDPAPWGSTSADDADASIEGTKYGEKLGLDVSSGGDLDGDGAEELLVLSERDGGTLFTFLGPLEGSLTVASADAVLDGGDIDFGGATVSGISDLDGDGMSDLILGTPHDATGGSNAGAAWYVSGDRFNIGELADADGVLVGEESENAGCSTGASGDLDGDGDGGILVAGVDVAWVWESPISGIERLRDATLILRGANPDGDGALGLGDINGDGLGDLLLGDPGYYDENTIQIGAVDLVYGQGL